MRLAMAVKPEEHTMKRAGHMLASEKSLRVFLPVNGIRRS